MKTPRKHDLRTHRIGGVFDEMETYCARCWQPVEDEQRDEPCPGESDPVAETVLLAFAIVALAAVAWFLLGFPVPR